MQDGWTDIAKRIRDRIVANAAAGEGIDAAAMLRAYEDSDDDKMAEIRARVDEIVHDPATAEALKPWYRQFCKRPTFNDEYLPAFNRPNVELVDVSEAKGVDHISKKGGDTGGDIGRGGQHEVGKTGDVGKKGQ